jgi:hypothetical protein
MSNTFVNATAANVGTTPVAVYTVPTGKKSIVIGLSVANILGSTLPVDVRIRKGSDSSYVYVTKATRVEAGLPLEIMRGNKIVLRSGDAVYISAPLDNAFDCVVSVLEDV